MEDLALKLAPPTVPARNGQVRDEDFAGRRVLVTGATGVVGSWLVKELLVRKAHVIALIQDQDPHSELYRCGDVQRVTIVNGRLEDFATLERAINQHEVDTVFHLGAQTQVRVAHRSPLHTFEANIRGTYNLLEACRVHQGIVERIVIASSDKAYGASPSLPYTEQMPLRGRHPYEVSKSCADLLAQSYHATYGLPVTIARCANIYGGGDLNWDRIVPGAIRAFLGHKPPVIRSDGTFVRDYLYVKDAVSAYISLAQHLNVENVPGEGFNFSANAPLTVLEMVKLIQRLMGCDEILPIVRDDARGEIHDQYLSAEKAHAVLGWSPRFSPEDGLRETIDWYRTYLGASSRLIHQERAVTPARVV
jgi:CDP-glucose 4,6-dehydratase